MAISVSVQVQGLTAKEDAALLEALDLQGSPPAGARIIRVAGPQGGGRRIGGSGTATQTTSVFVTTSSCPRSGASVARWR